MLSTLDTGEIKKQNWLPQFWIDFRRRFISLLGYQFRKFSPQLALGVLHNTNLPTQINKSKLFCVIKKVIFYLLIICFVLVDIIDKIELDVHFSTYDILRLEKYCYNMADYHLIMDLLPTLSKLYFQSKFGDTHFSAVQKVTKFVYIYYFYQIKLKCPFH